ncbi:hypothetical protein SAMN04487948_104133 [Halogranum amylolyticum]|uniref:Uncharacterized protein n=1 Tax=Halogranum amylolyticum TaxID=660520 RepID=A0A1H8RMS9_9EURY|nr:hypothetical protein [Halogranum amylolyticum]SEO67849.1 hypothetical protein SAMN04487948_104133 [Halogranum amylolyticum]
MIRIPITDRFREAAAEWGNDRLMSDTDAFEAKAEQALLEIEHLASDANDVVFEVDAEAGVIRHEPSEDLARFLAAQSAESGVDEVTIMRLYVDLFSRAFLDSDLHRPPDQPE